MTRTLTAFMAAAVWRLARRSVPRRSRRSRSTATPILLRTPPNVYVGEVAGVATNSRGHIFVYTRTGHPYATLADNRTFYRGGPRLFEFDRNGMWVQELGQDVYGFNAAIGLRVDLEDNVWDDRRRRQSGGQVRPGRDASRWSLGQNRRR